MRPLGQITISRRTTLFPALAALATVALVACGGGDDNGDEPAEQTPMEGQTPVEQTPVEQTSTMETDPEPIADEPPPAEESVPDAERELLAYGDSLEGELTAAGEERQFRFEGAENDLVRITVDGKDGMDPILTLLEPNRTEIAINDDLSTSNRDSLIIARLPTAGLQVVRVGGVPGGGRAVRDHARAAGGGRRRRRPRLEPGRGVGGDVRGAGRHRHL